MTPLRELGTWSGGNTPSKANDAYWIGGSIPWVSPKDMKVDEISSSEDRITARALEDGRVSMVPAGSVLFVTRSGILAHTLPVAVTKLPVTINQDLKALSPRADVLPKYVAHAVRSASQRILKECSKHGTTVASVDTNALLDFEVPMASLDEQRRIVAEIEKQFSRLDEAVANLQRVKARLKQHKAAVLQAAVEGLLVPNETSLPQQNANDLVDGKALLRAMLSERRDRWKGRGKYVEPRAPESTVEFELAEGWAVASVQQLSWLVEYGTSAKASEDATGVPVLRMGNLFEGEISFDQLKYLPKDHNEFPRLLLAFGDVLFNRTNSPELVGKTAVFKRNSPDCSFASYLIRVRTLSGFHPEFLAAYINSVHGRRWIGSVVTQQVGQANVNGTKLQALAVPLPPLAEQHRIVAEVDRRLSIVREVEAEVEANLKRSQALRQAILAKAFGAPPVSHVKPQAANKSN